MIKVQSFIQDKQSLQPVEVELALWPGLPGVQFLGLPDRHLKESAMRIKSAIKAAGFQFPIAQQILVNLRPSHLKKTSRGLELAVAAAYLWESGQLQAPLQSSDFYIYGELGLGGDVIEPEDLASASQINPHSVILTGRAESPSPAPFRRKMVTHLAELSRPQEIPARVVEELPDRPMELVQRRFSRSQARLLEILSVGEHSALLAGPAGSGKTTVAQSLSGFLREPTLDEFRKLKKIHQEFGSDLSWRPTVKPHHSTPTMAMIGGGNVPFAGEISRAHGGVLILDELLEFQSAVQEALREPFEEGKIRVCRNGKFKDFPAEAVIVATTNLCPCGKWTPVHKESKVCSFSNVRCQSYRHRLSGPLVDRFEILEFTEGIGQLEVDGESLLTRIRQAQDFSRSLQREYIKNSRKSFEGLVKNLFSHQLQSANLDSQTSQRRKLAVLRVARTLADLDLSEVIRREHLDEAVIRCQVHFQKLLNWI